MQAWITLGVSVTEPVGTGVGRSTSLFFENGSEMALRVMCVCVFAEGMNFVFLNKSIDFV